MSTGMPYMTSAQLNTQKARRTTSIALSGKILIFVIDWWRSSSVKAAGCHKPLFGFRSSLSLYGACDACDIPKFCRGDQMWSLLMNDGYLVLNYLWCHWAVEMASDIIKLISIGWSRVVLRIYALNVYIHLLMSPLELDPTHTYRKNSHK